MKKLPILRLMLALERLNQTTIEERIQKAFADHTEYDRKHLAAKYSKYPQVWEFYAMIDEASQIMFDAYLESLSHGVIPRISQEEVRDPYPVIFVDALRHRVVELPVRHADDIRTLLCCHTLACTYPDGWPGKDGLYVDDNAMDYPSGLFYIGERLIAGSGVIIGTDDVGGSITPTLTLDEAKEQIGFFKSNEEVKRFLELHPQ
jgi:hypothetical protein